MPSPERPKRTSQWPLVLAVVLVAMVLTCGVGLMALRWATKDLLGDASWNGSPISAANFEKTFGATYPKTAVGLLSRNTGFQDPHYEALFELPPAELTLYLRANGLVSSALPADYVPNDIADAANQVGTPTTVRLEGLHDLLWADGGTVLLNRSATLLTWPGHTFVYLVAFGT